MMSVKLLVRRVVSLFFQRFVPQTEEILKLEPSGSAGRLFSKRNLTRIFPNLRYNTGTDGNGCHKITVSHGSEPLLLFCLLSAKGKTRVRKRADRIITSAPARKGTFLVLTEYANPHQTRLNLSGEVEMLCARAEMHHRKQPLEIARFYLPEHSS